MKGFLRGNCSLWDKRIRRALWVTLTALGQLTVASAVSANELEVPLRVELDGTRDCPAADDFYAEVRERTEHARRAREGELGWSTSVSVKQIGDRRLARMTIRATEGEWIERELVAPTCSDAMEALAVVLAVLVDTAIGQVQVSNDSHDNAAAPSPPRLIPLPRVATGVYIPWIDDPDFFEKRGISLGTSRFIGMATGGVELDTQLAGHATMGMGIGFEIERWNPNLLRPSFGLSLGWSTGEVANDDLRVNLQHWSLRAHLCPFDLAQGRTVSLRPCGRIDAGYIYAYREDASDPNPQDQSRRFGMVRVSPFLRLDFVVASGAHLRFDGGADLLMRRPDIVFSQSGKLQLLHSPAPIGAYGAIAIGVEF